MSITREFRGRVGGPVNQETGEIYGQDGRVVGQVRPNLPRENVITLCPLVPVAVPAGATVVVTVAPDKQFLLDSLKFASECCAGIGISDIKWQGSPLLADGNGEIPLSLLSEVSTDNQMLSFEKPYLVSKTDPLVYSLTNHNAAPVLVCGAMQGSANIF